MFSKPSLSISAALLLSALGAVARAAPMPTRSDVSAAESGNPESTEYGTRMVSRRSPSNEELNANETGNPESIDYGKRATTAVSSNSNAAWQMLEAGNPDFR